MKKHAPSLVFAALVAAGLCGRLLPHAPNFTPVAAAALFAGFFLRSRMAAALVPLVTLAAGDALLGGYELPIMLAVYASFVAPVVLGGALAKRLTPLRLAGSAAASSLLFFVVTNGAVWAWSGLYGRSAAGLVECYVAALPFLKYTLAGDLGFAAVFFGAHLAAQRMNGQARLAPA